MNDNQYIAHSAVICHYGVKGMKWGKQLKRVVDEANVGISTTKNMLKQARSDTKAANRAYAKAQKERTEVAPLIGEYNTNNGPITSHVTLREYRAKTPQERQADAQRLQGSYNASQAAKSKQYALEQNLKKQKAEKRKAVVNTVFGKAKAFFGKPRLSKVVKKR